MPRRWHHLDLPCRRASSFSSPAFLCLLRRLEVGGARCPHSRFPPHYWGAGDAGWRGRPPAREPPATLSACTGPPGSHSSEPPTRPARVRMPLWTLFSGHLIIPPAPGFSGQETSLPSATCRARLCAPLPSCSPCRPPAGRPGSLRPWWVGTRNSAHRNIWPRAHPFLLPSPSLDTPGCWTPSLHL